MYIIHGWFEMCPDLGGGHRFGVATIANTPLSRVQNQQGIWGCTRECRLEVSNCFDHNCIAAIYTCNSNSISSCFVSSKEKSSDARGKTPFRGSANSLSYLLSMGNLRYSKRKTLALPIVSEVYGDQQKRSSRITMFFVGKSYARSKSAHQFLGKYGKQ